MRYLLLCQTKASTIPYAQVICLYVFLGTSGMGGHNYPPSQKLWNAETDPCFGFLLFAFMAQAGACNSILSFQFSQLEILLSYLLSKKRELKFFNLLLSWLWDNRGHSSLFQNAILCQTRCLTLWKYTISKLKRNDLVKAN